MLQVALKALNTYKHIFVISLYDTYGALKEREAAQTQAEGKNQPHLRLHSPRVEDG